MASLNPKKRQEEVEMVFPDGEAGGEAEGTGEEGQDQEGQEGEEQEKENGQGDYSNSLDDTESDGNDVTETYKEVRKLTKKPAKVLDKNVSSLVCLGPEECDQIDCKECKDDRDNSTPNPNGFKWKDAFQAANARHDFEREVSPIEEVETIADVGSDQE